MEGRMFAFSIGMRCQCHC